MKIEVIEAFDCVQVGHITDLPNDLATDLIERGLAKEHVSVEDLIDVTVTQETLDLNPELSEEGVEVGDIIQIEAEEAKIEEIAPETKELKTKPNTK